VVGASRTNVTVAVAEPDVAPVAVIVIVDDDATVGVPEIAPVEAFNDRPAGNDPDVTAYVTAPVNAVAVNAVEAVIATPTVPERV
jgi:hypothetical protein